MTNLLRKRGQKGFTLVELMVVLLIIGILVAIAIPIYNNTQSNARKRACQDNLRTIDGAAAQYQADKGNYPDTIGAMVGTYLKAEPRCPNDTSKPYKWDKTTGTATCPNDPTNHKYP